MVYFEETATDLNRVALTAVTTAPGKPIAADLK